MRVARRSHLSRIASDDDWFTESWWDDGAHDPDEPLQEQRPNLYGPRLAQNVPQGTQDQTRRDGPFIDHPRLAKGRTRGKKRDK